MAIGPNLIGEKNPRTVRQFMWNVSEPLANLLFDISGALLIFGAVLVAIGTWGTIQMGGAKEYFANERVSANEAETARAKADAAIANQKAESERVERLRLEVRLAPRSLAGASAAEFSNTLAPLVHGMAIDVISYEGMGADVALLSQQIAGALNAAGATAVVLTPMGSGGVVVQGIVVRSATDASASEKSAIGPIVDAFHKAGFAAGPFAEYPVNEPPSGGYMGPQGHPLAKIRLLVGAKS